MQPALALGDGEFVIRLGEVVHADVNVAGFGQAADAELQQLQLGIGRGHVATVDAALRLEQPGQVRIAVQRDAVGRDIQHLLERAVEADHVLLGQAVDQVHADRLEAGGTRRVDDEPGLLRSLRWLLRGQYEVAVASSGFDGLALLGAENFDVVISDQRMPGMTGTEFLERANARLTWVVPATLLIIFVLLYLTFSRFSEALLIMATLPFALSGGIWLLYWFGFNLSVATGVGFIALAGVSAEFGVIMLLARQGLAKQ